MTCTQVPWYPPQNRQTAYFINSIVLGEESDDLGTQHPEKALSHLELYLGAMKEIKADTKLMEKFVSALQNGEHWLTALDQMRKASSLIPQSTFDFVEHSIGIATEKSVHEVAASFLFGREDPIPAMFQRILDNLQE